MARITDSTVCRDNDGSLSMNAAGHAYLPYQCLHGLMSLVQTTFSVADSNRRSLWSLLYLQLVIWHT